MKEKSGKVGLKVSIKKQTNKLRSCYPAPWLHVKEKAKNESSDRFYFIGLQKSQWTVITAMKLNDFCSLGGNLNTILKNRDIVLLTKVHIVEAMVFPVVMYECESWNIKKTEGQIIDNF